MSNGIRVYELTGNAGRGRLPLPFQRALGVPLAYTHGISNLMFCIPVSMNKLQNVSWLWTMARYFVYQFLSSGPGPRFVTLPPHYF